tara:strand:- start:54 stop:308 length:255 start_codon:yes stop_codon:yes gene_type:complete
MDYDEMTDHIVKFEVGALYYITGALALYLGLRKFVRKKPVQTHIFYIYGNNRNRRITNSQAIRMAYSLHKLITKVETDVTVTAR